MSSTTPTKAILFIGATGGCGRSALQHSLDAGHTCVALARTPSKLHDVFPSNKYPNLRVGQGNAHDKAAIVPLLAHPADPSRLVDHIIFSIGASFDMSKFALDDRDVCKKGIAALLDALAEARSALSPPSAAAAATAYPRFAFVSTTGISKFGCDLPIGMAPLYKTMFKIPLRDKEVAESMLTEAGGRGMQERWTMVRPSMLVGGGASDKKIRVGIEDPVKGWEAKSNGYTISREDVGKWIFQNLVQEQDEKWVRKTATISW
ncbi:hypothetical protein MKZ38_000452 [Zalerion maritima]|uniref:NAD(P)-binding domain-containing protein n=1 Tax=Zalerion maritima TaxID=339359 RepID=A0AAD5RZJ1_9PEZI|nr:hypothetical protein MKZ38_000452 [Zalerion maritima]